ncbi:Uncharacterized protein LHYA1_G000325 [Lachnellula hyalina]|uniref:Carbonic anhydrase n=1 Tax=Lachnellula hyalina TaxID=1316788 RepID=A0A8H8R9D5_9HELO|nr:Uncharacterized protein LHYA1_G000325 [Lachnellula hyalina]TVY30761.1 Uncharacterized protein LHYA1_G000325 [Lachnellula hyalina]
MGAQVTVEDLLKRNAQISQNSYPTLPEVPLPNIFIVTCCDPRVDPVEMLGLERYEATVNRSPAGRIRPHFQGLLFLDQIIKFSEIMIIHHTDCSAAVLKSDDVRTALKTSAPGKSSDIDDLVLPGFDE